MAEKTEKPKKKKSKNLYFNSDTQAAIVEHQNSESELEKEQIFVSRIFPAFDKLVENLINIHRFAGQYDSHDDLKSDCVSFLYESIHKFDASRGTNAFSYFNIVAKHWLIIRSKKRFQRQKRNVSIDDMEALSKLDTETIEEHGVLPPQDEIIADNERVRNIIAMLEEIRERLKNPNELACIDAIVTLFSMSNELDLLNKSAVLMYIREMSGLTPKQLTMTMYQVKRHYRELKGDDRFDLFGL